MADADSDGAHIRCLLATLFFKYMPDLITEGRVYTAVPPLHRIELSNPKKGMDKYVYTYSDAELQRKLAELTKKGVRWKDPVQRYKGLGEMDADQLAETTMDPRHRTLRRITVDDADAAAEVFELLMGTDVAPRKEFIVQGAYEVDADADRRLSAARPRSDLLARAGRCRRRRGSRRPRPCRGSAGARGPLRRRRASAASWSSTTPKVCQDASWPADCADPLAQLVERWRSPSRSGCAGRPGSGCTLSRCTPSTSASSACGGDPAAGVAEDLRVARA